MRTRFVGLVWVVALVAGILVTALSPASGKDKPPHPHPAAATTTTTTQPSSAAGFVFGELNTGSGCGSNIDGEPAVRVSYDNNVVVASEEGLGSGSDAWHGAASASACGLSYAGQPNAVAPGLGASGGDVDVAVGSSSVGGHYPVYVASLNVGSVSVAHSTDGGATYTNVPVVAGLPLDDREWIAAYGASTALLTYHDISTDEIDVLRSDDGGATFREISQAIALTSPAVGPGGNEIGNIAIDRLNTAGAATGQFWAYQSYVSFANANSAQFDEAYLAVSNDGGSTWVDKPIGCSLTNASSTNGLDHEFPNVSVAPNGDIWVTWSDDVNVFAAKSSDHGGTWTCAQVSANKATKNGPQAIMPWIRAGSGGVDLVYYNTAGGTNETWYVAFAQYTGSWGSPQDLLAVHTGSVCEQGATCSGGRQLFDDFGVDVDTSGDAHIAYSHDAPGLGGSGTYTGYAVQTSGTGIGTNN